MITQSQARRHARTQQRAQSRPRAHTAVLAALTALLLAGTVGCTPTPGPTPEVDATSLAAKVTAAFTEEAERLDLVGAFLLVRTPEGEFTAASGSTEMGTQTAPTADTVFRIGSNTKTMTGTVILQLVDEGLIRLDDTVSMYQPDVPGGDQITIEMLLNMRSGVFDFTTDERLWEEVFADPERGWQRDELLAVAYRNEPLFAPGTDYAYSNTNTVLLAVIAEQITGSPIDALIADRITDPLGLTHTALPAIDDFSLQEPFTHGYAYLSDDAAEPEDVTFLNPSWVSAAGAGVSTATELADWVEALTGGELLSEELQAQRLASIAPIPGAPDAENWGYGLGIAKLHGLLGHNGMIPGYNSYMGTDPARGLTVIIWANVAPTSDGESPVDQLASTVVPLLLAE